MKRRFSTVLCGAVLAAALGACGGGDDGPALATVDAEGTTSIQTTALAGQLTAYPMTSLSAEEAASLAFMREEERLAHDVYAASATLWPQPIFGNIAESEATHTAAVKLLLDRYGLPDPLAGLPEGTFKTPAFQTLYAAYVASSKLSLIDALKVGVEIEELDIRDINAQKSNVDNADILLVYDQLLRGSRNHLRSYMKVLTQQGGTYVPKYISQAEFDSIVDTSIETGR